MNTKTRKIQISHKQLEDAVVSYLYAISVLDDDVDVAFADFGIPIDKNGMVTFDLEIIDSVQTSLDV